MLHSLAGLKKGFEFSISPSYCAVPSELSSLCRPAVALHHFSRIVVLSTLPLAPLVISLGSAYETRLAFKIFAQHGFTRPSTS